jgi:alpha-glucuronidase
LTDIVGNHYGVAVEASEKNGWGQWHRADAQGVGMDRTVARGTGFIGQYRPEVARQFEILADCPDDLLLFMHHVPYTYRLHSGKTVIQFIYDSHFDGAAQAEQYVQAWKGLAGLVDVPRYNEILKQLEYQAGAAELWRDAVVEWFAKASGIADDQGRVGNHSGRYEAESSGLTGYAQVEVKPWEAASGGRAVECHLAECTAAFDYTGQPGRHTIHIRYFDQDNGAASYQLKIAGRLVDKWVASEHLPTKKLDGTSSMRRVVADVDLKAGDRIEIVGRPDGQEAAALDYVEILP